MKRFILTIFLMIPAFIANAQNVQSESLNQESSELGSEIQIDSTLYGKDIFSVLPSDMIVSQGQDLRTALNNQIIRNEANSFSGFRIRIFIDSKRGAREASLKMLQKFNESFPKVPAYRTYAAPNFKVSVGNFRNRVEAEAFLKIIKDEFTEAFIVRERFKYPSIGAPDTNPEDEPIEIVAAE